MDISEKVQTDFYWGLLRLTMAVKKRFIIAGEELDLTPLQGITLCMLRADRPCTMSSIAKIASCDPSNLSDTIEKLVRSGLVERQESPHDRRNKLLVLTPQGTHVRQELFNKANSEELPGRQALTDEEAAEFRRLLVKLFVSD